MYSPAVEQYYSDHYGVEHHFCGEAEVLLNCPEHVNAYKLSGNTDNEQVSECECVVRNNGILEGGDDRDACI